MNSTLYVPAVSVELGVETQGTSHRPRSAGVPSSMMVQRISMNGSVCLRLILNVMLVAVSERTAEIGLLRALGASRSQILMAFLVEAAILSCAGGALGQPPATVQPQAPAGGEVIRAGVNAHPRPSPGLGAGWAKRWVRWRWP